MSIAHGADGVGTLTPEALQARLDEPGLLLLQITRPEVYEQAHLPGAMLVTPPQLVGGVPPATGRLPELAQLTALFTAIGYTPEADIVLYDDEGGGWAGRMAWTLDVIGHRQWHYLDGGMHAWAAAGLPFANGAFPRAR